MAQVKKSTFTIGRVIELEKIKNADRWRIKIAVEDDAAGHVKRCRVVLSPNGKSLVIGDWVVLSAPGSYLPGVKVIRDGDNLCSPKELGFNGFADYPFIIDNDDKAWEAGDFFRPRAPDSEHHHTVTDGKYRLDHDMWWDYKKNTLVNSEGHPYA